MASKPDGTRESRLRLHVRPELRGEYHAVHSPMRREMFEAIAASGRRSYSLFRNDTDGTLFGHYEVDYDGATQAALAGSDVATQWEAEMSGYFMSLGRRADHAARRLPEVLNLTDQLESP